MEEMGDVVVLDVITRDELARPEVSQIAWSASARLPPGSQIFAGL